MKTFKAFMKIFRRTSFNETSFGKLHLAKLHLTNLFGETSFGYANGYRLYWERERERKIEKQNDRDRVTLWVLLYRVNLSCIET